MNVANGDIAANVENHSMSFVIFLTHLSIHLSVCDKIISYSAVDRFAAISLRSS